MTDFRASLALLEGTIRYHQRRINELEYRKRLIIENEGPAVSGTRQETLLNRITIDLDYESDMLEDYTAAYKLILNHLKENE